MSRVLVRLFDELGNVEEDVLLSRVPSVGEEIEISGEHRQFRVIRVVHRGLLSEQPASTDYAGGVYVEEIPLSEP